RKQLLRYLIRDVTLSKGAETISIEVRWQTGAVTELAISRLPAHHKWTGVQTDVEVIKRLGELSEGRTDEEIAEQLNVEGYRSCLGRAFTGSNVCHLRGQNGIKKGNGDGDKLLEEASGRSGRYRVSEVAKLLKVSVSTVTRWCKEGRLEAEQSGEHGMYWVLGLPELKEERLERPLPLN
ncbi:MAG: helix-turn-helix domain-containing protein, partial [Chloroflexota bacterium]